jgi:hypothetical protein
MSMVAGRGMEPVGKARGADDHGHDMIDELSKRLDAWWRYDPKAANAEKDSHSQEFWRGLKTREQENLKRLKEFIRRHIENNCF